MNTYPAQYPPNRYCSWDSVHANCFSLKIPPFSILTDDDTKVVVDCDREVIVLSVWIVEFSKACWPIGLVRFAIQTMPIGRLTRCEYWITKAKKTSNAKVIRVEGTNGGADAESSETLAFFVLMIQYATIRANTLVDNGAVSSCRRIKKRLSRFFAAVNQRKCRTTRSIFFFPTLSQPPKTANEREEGFSFFCRPNLLFSSLSIGTENECLSRERRQTQDRRSSMKPRKKLLKYQ